MAKQKSGGAAKNKHQKKPGGKKRVIKQVNNETMVTISSALSNIVGSGPMLSSDVTRKLHVYIHEKKLHEPGNPHPYILVIVA